MESEGREVNFEDFSIEQLEKHRKWLKQRVQQATAAAKANQAIAQVENEVAGLGETEIAERIAATRERLKQLQSDVDTAASQFSLKEDVLDTIAESLAGYNMLFPLPDVSTECDRTDQPRASSGGMRDAAGDTTSCYTSPIAREVCELVTEQVELSSRLVRREAEARQLEEECADLHVKMSVTHVEQQNAVADWKAKKDETAAAMKSAAIAAGESSANEKVLQEKLHRYKCRVVILRHILQSLILGSGLEWPELEKWRAIALECGNPMEEDADS